MNLVSNQKTLNNILNCSLERPSEIVPKAIFQAKYAKKLRKIY